MEKILIERTRSGNPAAWEWGGGATNTGAARVWAEQDGSAPRAIYIRRRGHLAGGDHALVLVRRGMWTVIADHHRGDWLVEASRVVGTQTDQDGDLLAVLEPVAMFRRGEWSAAPLPDKLKAAVEAAKTKAACYHCRQPHFVAGDEAARHNRLAQI